MCVCVCVCVFVCVRRKSIVHDINKNKKLKIYIKKEASHYKEKLIFIRLKTCILNTIISEHFSTFSFYNAVLSY